MPQFPFSAIVGADDMGLARTLTARSNESRQLLVRADDNVTGADLLLDRTECLPPEQVAAEPVAKVVRERRAA